VLTVTQMLRAKGVVGRFVEFYGPGLDAMTLADRATIANMAPEYGATCGFFPIDNRTLDYLRLSGRDDDRIALVEAYAKAQGMWRDADTPEPLFTDTLELDLGSVVPSLAGPKRPQDRVLLSDVDDQFNAELADTYKKATTRACRSRARARPRQWRRGDRRHHQLHQHLQPERADRRRPGRPQGARARPRPQAVGQDQPGAGKPGGDRLSRPRRPVRRT
jgi:aconitase A